MTIILRTEASMPGIIGGTDHYTEDGSYAGYSTLNTISGSAFYTNSILKGLYDDGKCVY